MLLKRLASARLAAFLIGMLVVLCLISFVVPQSSHSSLSLHDEWSRDHPALAGIATAVGFDDVFASPLFYVLTVVLAVNLTACTLLRIRRRGSRRLRVPERAPETALRARVGGTREEVSALAARSLPSWRPLRASSGERTLVFFDRDFYGFCGSVIMHAGLLLLIVGGLVSGLTRFDGLMDLTEGEMVADAAASYVRPPREPVLGAAYDPFSVRLDSLRFEYESGSITQSYAQMTFADANASAALLSKVNAPATWHGKAFLMVKGGHAVRLSVVATDGAVLLPETVVRLGTAAEGGYADGFELPDGTTLTLRTRAHAADKGLARTETMRLRDPDVTVGIAGRSGAEAARPGETVELDGMRVRVGDVRLWNEFAVREDGGIPITYAAFAVILVGTALRFVFGKQTAACLLEEDGDGILVAAWSTDDRVAARILDALSDARAETRSA